MNRKWTRSSGKDILSVTAPIREKMDKQYLRDTRQMKEISSCFRSARNLYDRVIKVDKVDTLGMDTTGGFIFLIF